MPREITYATGELELMAAKVWREAFTRASIAEQAEYIHPIDPCEVANVALWHFRNQFLPAQNQPQPKKP